MTWPTDPIRPWTIIIAKGSLAQGPATNRLDDPFPRFLSCEELSARLRMPVVAVESTCGTPPYQTHGSGDRRLVAPEDEEELRNALNHTREMLFAHRPAGVTSEAAMTQWCRTHLQTVRRLLEAEEAALEVGAAPGPESDALVDAVIAYGDALFAWHTRNEDEDEDEA